MIKPVTKHCPGWPSLILAAASIASNAAKADVVCDGTSRRRDRRRCANGAAAANRAMAIVHTAVYEAVNAITGRYPASTLKLEAAPGASVDAAVAAASRTALAKLLPSQQGAIDAAYQAALAKVADGSAKTAGIALGEQAAAAVLAARADDGEAAAESLPAGHGGGRLRADGRFRRPRTGGSAGPG